MYLYRLQLRIHPAAIAECYTLMVRSLLRHSDRDGFMQTYARSLFMIVVLFIAAGCAQKSFASEAHAGSVRFSIRALSAKSVALAGTFNHWDPEKDRLAGPDRDGIWTITLPLADGRYEYCFVINGKDWMPDPSAPSVDDELGRRNSVIIVAP